VKHALFLSLCLICVVSAVFAAPLDPQITTAMQEKRTRTAAQRKIDSQLLFALYRERGEAEAKGVPPGDLLVKFDAKRRALVTIRARVTTDLLAAIKKLGGEVVSSSERDNDIRAYLPLGKLEELAASKTVSAIMPAEEATTNRPK
jgi:hypothetical protein